MNTPKERIQRHVPPLCTEGLDIIGRLKPPECRQVSPWCPPQVSRYILNVRVSGCHSLNSLIMSVE